MAAFTWSTPGTRTVTVTASSPAGVAKATHIIHIDDHPIAGLAAMNDGPTSLGQATVFSATVLSGTNVVYTWEFGDDSVGSGQLVAHTYAMTGTYTATVTARNSAGSANATTVVTILDNGVPNYELYLPVAVKP